MTKKSKFDFLREHNQSDEETAENINHQNAELSSTQNSEDLRTQNSEDSTIQQSDQSNTRPSKTPGRPKGKRSNPEYTQVTSYVRKDTYKQVKRELLDDDREFSDLVQQLLEQWLQSSN